MKEKNGLKLKYVIYQINYYLLCLTIFFAIAV